MEVVFIIFVSLVTMLWIFMHYTTNWKKNRAISTDDEQLLDDLHHVAQRLDDRLQSIERIMDVDNPDWRRLSSREAEDGMLDQKIEERSSNIRRIS